MSVPLHRARSRRLHQLGVQGTGGGTADGGGDRQHEHPPAGSDRKTVAKYVAAALAAGLQRGAPGPTDEQVAAVLAGIRAIGGGRPGAVPGRLAVHREQIVTWLAEGLRLTKIHRRLREQGVTVPYSSLHRFAQVHLGFGAPTITVRVAEPPPGEAAEVDFGVLGLWFDPIRGRRCRVYGLLVTLCFSRYAFLAISLRQDLAAVLDGLESAWVCFGGVVKRLVADNLKPVVTRPDRYAPRIDRVFLEYAQYRGFIVDPAIVRHATGKAYASYCTSLIGCGVDLLSRVQAESPFHL